MYRLMHRLYAPVLAIIAVFSSSAASSAPQSSASAEDPLIPFKTLLAPATVQEGDHLFLQLAGQPRAEILPSSETEFFFKTVSSTVTFVKDKEGKVTKLIFTSGGKAYEGIKVK